MGRMKDAHRVAVRFSSEEWAEGSLDRLPREGQEIEMLM